MSDASEIRTNAQFAILHTVRLTIYRTGQPPMMGTTFTHSQQESKKLASDPTAHKSAEFTTEAMHNERLNGTLRNVCSIFALGSSTVGIWRGF